jgi:chromosome segregation ATPase
MMLGRYIGNADAEHPIEAATLRRVALRVDSLSHVAGSLANKMQVSNGEVTSANSRAADAKSDAKAAAADNKDQDAEIRRLRGELASAREELERIKKRLAEPQPKKPPVR